MKSPLTSRDLLASADVPITEKPEIPAEYLPLLITSVINFVSARKFREALENAGDTLSLRDINAWQHATRAWLGLPEVGRGKPSADNRNAVKQWLHENGNPTLEEIDAGWIPAHRRENQTIRLPASSPRYQRIIEEFRAQKTSLNAAKNDEEVRLLLSQYLDRQDIMDLLDQKNWIRFDLKSGVGVNCHLLK